MPVPGVVASGHVTVGGGGSTASDPFTYSNGALATVSSGVWVNQVSSLDVISNQVTTTTFGLLRWSTAFTATHFSQIDVTAQPPVNFSEADVWTRMPTSGYTGMVGLLANNTSNINLTELALVVSGGYTTLYSVGPQAAPTGTLKLESSGSSHSLYLNGSLLTTQTDSTLNANTSVGIGAECQQVSPPLRLDNWVGGDI
jgi:hypothetical protein